ncbi:hypothetical protein RclHR1_21130004 [Rhizophagus clarus]|uniref:Uncharacterized protein n=1 Tax=Rhizophagus clarus TaxID=94130 RepID=A0A2Z6RLC5_9GLOM|nr:hypothetical protein RclHR1_21130004 [Rhizophagus clarus]GES82678.1 hypothetical protein GLOIN_2v1763802 [Rhizophagus clarus]
MTNVYTLKDINNKGDGSFREVAEINDFSKKLLAKYLEREKESRRTYADIGNKISQLNASSIKVRSQLISEQKSHSESQRKLEAKYSAKVKLLKLNIKSLKRELTLAQKASSIDKIQIFSLKTEIRKLEGKLEDLKLNQSFHNSNKVGGKEPALISSSDPKEIDSLRLELEQVKGDLNSKEYTIKCMKKGIEETHEITSQKLDDLFSARLNLTKENSHLREIISKKDNEIADLSNPSLPPMNDSSQKLPGWVSNNLRPLVYKLSLENKVMKLDKRFARENILEVLQELLPQDKMVLKSRVPTETISQVESLPNQFVYSRPTNSEKYILKEEGVKQLGSAEADSLMSPLITYSFLILLLIAIIWFIVKKIQNWWSAKSKEKG